MLDAARDLVTSDLHVRRRLKLAGFDKADKRPRSSSTALQPTIQQGKKRFYKRARTTNSAEHNGDDNLTECFPFPVLGGN